ncbi:MAG: fatty acid desaturase [Alphaproteobacteria bacterium]|nr:fatty acid desaturase [Alphaproteobacteria bacterium]
MILRDNTEWRTLALIAMCYGLWLIVLLWLSWSVPWLAGLLLIPLLTLHSSLQHECLHGHPFTKRWLNDLIVAPPIGLLIPYLRFKDVHLQHHQNASICDPYDDPESWYVSQDFWVRLPRMIKIVFQANNTLVGRMVLGPAISLVRLAISDGRAILAGDRRVQMAWVLHGVLGTGVLYLVANWSGFGIIAYLVCCYCGMSVLMIRTYLEHQAEESYGGRSVIIEDKGPLSLLFLNNNLHAVHHAYPAVAWHQLPSLYQRHRERFIAMNKGYGFRSYGEILRRFAFHRKEPVAYPLTPKKPQ